MLNRIDVFNKVRRNVEDVCMACNSELTDDQLDEIERLYTEISDIIYEAIDFDDEQDPKNKGL